MGQPVHFFFYTRFIQLHFVLVLLKTRKTEFRAAGEVCKNLTYNLLQGKERVSDSSGFLSVQGDLKGCGSMTTVLVQNSNNT